MLVTLANAPGIAHSSYLLFILLFAVDTKLNKVSITGNCVVKLATQCCVYAYLLEWFRVGLSWVVRHVRNVGFVEVWV